MAISQCFLCVHYKKDLKCRAFPRGIPKRILYGGFDHKEKYPHQQGDIVFEAANRPSRAERRKKLQENNKDGTNRN